MLQEAGRLVIAGIGRRIRIAFIGEAAPAPVQSAVDAPAAANITAGILGEV